MNFSIVLLAACLGLVGGVSTHLQQRHFVDIPSNTSVTRTNRYFLVNTTIAIPFVLNITCEPKTEDRNDMSCAAHTPDTLTCGLNVTFKVGNDFVECNEKNEWKTITECDKYTFLSNTRLSNTCEFLDKKAGCCPHNHTWFNNDGEYTSTLPIFHKGRYCRCDHCKNTPTTSVCKCLYNCRPGGTCVKEKNGKATCKCTYGFYGNACQYRSHFKLFWRGLLWYLGVFIARL